MFSKVVRGHVISSSPTTQAHVLTQAQAHVLTYVYIYIYISTKTIEVKLAVVESIKYEFTLWRESSVFNQA